MNRVRGPISSGQFWVVLISDGISQGFRWVRIHEMDYYFDISGLIPFNFIFL